MFDVGFWELIILFGLGLVILGPERLPKVAMQVGNWVGQARRMARSMTSQLRDELDINKPYTPPTSTYNRPGMDDLKPNSTAETDNTIHAGADEPSSDEPESDEPGSDDPERDDRDHSDAGADDDPAADASVEEHERSAS
jgi:sec-independent protein translocase protein TatB